MIRNYLLRALTMIVRHKLYSMINILSLAAGLIAGLFIYLYIDFETSFDTHWPDAERIYRPHTDYRAANVPPLYDAWVPFLLEGALERTFPDQIEAAGSAVPAIDLVRLNGEVFPQTILAARKDLLTVLHFESLRGGALPPFQDPNSIYISEKTVPKFFGDEDPIGKAIEIDIGDDRGFVGFIVRGVFKDLPANTHMQVQIMREYSDAELGSYSYRWTSFSMMTYIRLRQGVDIRDIEARIDEMKQANIPDITNASGIVVPLSQDLNFSLLPITALHMDNARGDITGNLTPQRGDPATVRALIAVGIAIVLIAAINFVNLTTARAGLRGREVALRKTMGAERQQLITQFLIEAVVMSAIAGLLAILGAKLALPYFAAALDLPIVFTLFGDHGVFIPLSGVVLILGLLGGFYPAWHLSGFQPADILRANKSTPNRVTLRLRQALVILQFSASIALIVSTMVVFQQTQFARSVDTGFDLDNQILISGLNSIGAEIRNDRTKALAERISRLPGVRAVSRHRAPPNRDIQNFLRLQRLGQESDLALELAVADGAYDDVFGVTVLAGRFLDIDIASDAFPSAASGRTDFNIVINEKAVRSFGFTSPEEAIGQMLITSLRTSGGTLAPVQATIVGVVENIQFGSVRGPIEPVVFTTDTSFLWDMGVRFTGRIGPQIRAQIEDIWHEILPDAPLIANYLNGEIAALYNEDEKRGIMFAAFTMLAVLIACVGLFGLSAFSIEQRTKEIGVRKILGATTLQITNMLSWQFSKFAIFANVFGWPVAWVVTQNWLENFSTRIDPGFWPFLSAGIIAFLIAWVTVAAHALRAGLDNPIHSLRAE